MAEDYVAHGKYACFYGGPLSQWYKCKIIDGNLIFNCTEQMMMYRKAERFRDKDTMNLIMGEMSPKKQKLLGRNVKGFDPEVWHNEAQNIVYRNNMLKFSQNRELKKILLSAGDLIFVEASPNDKIWGIGRSIDYPFLDDKNKWQGTNWLGNILTDIKQYFLNNSL